jgi:hypothetical protein
MPNFAIMLEKNLTSIYLNNVLLSLGFDFEGAPQCISLLDAIADVLNNPTFLMQKGRIHIPKEVRDKLGKEGVKRLDPRVL